MGSHHNKQVEALNLDQKKTYKVMNGGDEEGNYEPLRVCDDIIPLGCQYLKKNICKMNESFHTREFYFWI